MIWLRNSNETDLVTLLRLDDRDEFVVAVNLANRPHVGWVEVLNSPEFKPVKIAGLGEPTAAGFPLFRLGAFEWRIYHRTVPR